MANTKIKICGIRRNEDAEYINEVLPEFAGFVFWDKSKRNVSFEEAVELRRAIDKRIATVGVFVDPDPEFVRKLTDNGVISYVQLHGKESEEYIRVLREMIGESVYIIKAYEVSDLDGVRQANMSGADMVLIDSGKGSGNTFDWSLLTEINRDYFLAGGLSAENVKKAIEALHPYAVDVSSKVETDGCKDRDKINEFCSEVRAAK